MNINSLTLSFILIMRTLLTIALIVSCVMTAYAEAPSVPLTRGYVVDAAGKPLAKAVVRCDFYRLETHTDENGRFEIAVPFPENRRLRVFTEDRSLTRLSTFLFPAQANPETGEFRIQLHPPRRLVGRVVDSDQKPIAGASVWSETIQGTTDITVSDENGEFVLYHDAKLPLRQIAAQKSGEGIDFLQLKEDFDNVPQETYNDGPFTITLTGAKTARFKVLDENQNPIPDAEVVVWYFPKEGTDGLNPAGFDFVRQKTDEQGIALFDWLPNWCVRPVDFLVFSRKQEENFLPHNLQVDLNSATEEITVWLRKGVRVSGTVRFPDGSPAISWRIRAQFSQIRPADTQTDAQGRFAMIVEKHARFHLICGPPCGNTVETGAASTLFDMNSGENGIDEIKVQLHKPTRVFGHISGNPPEGDNKRIQSVQLFEANPNVASEPYHSVSPRWFSVDNNDDYSLWLAPGKYRLQFRNDDDSKDFTTSTGQEELRIDYENTVHSPQERNVKLHVLYPGEEKTPAANATVHFFPLDRTRDHELSRTGLTDENGSINLSVVKEEAFLFARSEDRKFGYGAKISAEETERTIVMVPTVSARGRLIRQGVFDSPIVGRRVEAGPARLADSWKSVAITNEQGEFECDGLLPGIEHEFRLPLSPRDWPDAVREWRPLTKTTPTARATLDIGTLEVYPDLGGFGEIEWAFWGIYRSYLGGKTLESLYHEQLKRAQTENKRLLILFANFDHESLFGPFLHMQLSGALYNDPQISPLFFENYVFQGIPIDKTDANYGRAQAFAKSRGIDENAAEQLTFCVIDADGNVLCTKTLVGMMVPPQNNTLPLRFTVDHVRLHEFLDGWKPRR